MEKIPLDLRNALARSTKVTTQWKSLTPIARRDFISWIESAKQKETRARRIAIAYDKLLAGKRRPCCYAVVPMGLYKELDASPKAKSMWKTLTPDQRRDLTDWIDEAEGRNEKEERIRTISSKLAKGVYRVT